MTLAAYREQTDAEICADYGTRGMRSVLEEPGRHPGCGIFMPEASFMALDTAGSLCGYIVCSRISTRRAMIPRSPSTPRASTRGWATPDGAHPGPAARRRLPLASLTVTERNTRAFEWYRRLGFSPHAVRRLCLAALNHFS